MLSFAAIHVVSLTAPPRQHSFCRGDLIAFPLYAVSLALFAVVVSQGRTAWWRDTPWLGECLAAAIACLGLYVAFELRRPRPMLDLRWLMSPYMLRFVLAVLLFRIILSEQTVAMVGLMTVLGQSNEQMRTLFALVTLGIVSGFGIAIVMAARQQAHLLTLLAVSLIIVAALMDSNATSLTRPVDLYFSQTLLAVALAVFFSAACLLGFGPVVQDGLRNIISFLAAFTFAQYMGSLLGSAWIATLVAERQQWHYAALVQHLSLSDPQVALRVAQLSGSVARVVTDPAARSLQGVSLLSQQVTRESFVLAYNDVFMSIAALACVMLVWLAMLARRQVRRAAAARIATAPTPST